MKNMFLKISIIAAIALTMMAGSASADTCTNTQDSKCLQGQMGWAGNGAGKYTSSSNLNTMIGISFDRYVTLNGYGTSSGAMLHTTIETPTYDLKTIAENAKYDPHFPYVAEFPVDGMLFMNGTGGFLENVVDFSYNAGFKFGDIQFNCNSTGDCDVASFYIDKIDTEKSSFTVTGDSSGLYLFMTGYVDATGFNRTWATYSFSFNTASSGNPYIWNMDVVMDAALNAPEEVPEPGTLVLLGTGLLGAAIAARRKMSK